MIDDKEWLMYLYYAAATVGATIVRYYWKSNEKKSPTIFSTGSVVKELSTSTVGALITLSIIPVGTTHDKVIAIVCLAVLLSEDIINLIFLIGPGFLHNIVNKSVNNTLNTINPPNGNNSKDEVSDKKGTP